jgi:hypothetical protein
MHNPASSAAFLFVNDKIAPTLNSSRRAHQGRMKTMAKSSSKKSSRGKSSSRKKSSGRKYGKKAQNEVRTEMHHMRSGKHKVKNRKQAIAIGLSKARQKGAKVPRKKSSSRKAA